MESAGAININFTLHWLDWTVILLYLVGIVYLGVWFGKFTKSTNDFFLGGQRFSWWVGSIACVATLVGSYSFLQYSQNGYNFGFSSIVAYTNEWFVLPLFLLIWLPIVYYSRLTSIPEYFQKRFDEKTRIVVLCIMLIYLQGYIGINLYTIGVAIHGILGWDITFSAAFISVLTGIVIYAGGATSVMMADLIQAFLLLSAGILVFYFGIDAVGGFSEFWNALPTRNQLPFANFNSPAEFNFIGDFWSDAMTGTVAFYFINQSVLMRILSVKSVRESRKTIIFTVLVLMPIAAISVSGGGWVARAMVEKGLLTVPGDNAKDVFIQVSKILCGPGFFGFVMVAMLAALMSTLEALINAVSAIAVNDIWKPYVKKNQSDQYYLKIARYIAIFSNIVGILLIPIFASFASIYQALAHFTAITTPPLIVVIVLGAIWNRFTAAGAFWTLILGSLIVVVSLFYPGLVDPIAHGEAVNINAPTWEQHSYMRSLFALIVCTILGIIISFLTKPKSKEDLEGLVISSIELARTKFKGGTPSDECIGLRINSTFTEGLVTQGEIQATKEVWSKLKLSAGDLVYVSDARGWLGGLRSIHLKVSKDVSNTDSLIMTPFDIDQGNLISGNLVSIEKIM